MAQLSKIQFNGVTLATTNPTHIAYSNGRVFCMKRQQFIVATYDNVRKMLNISFSSRKTRLHTLIANLFIPNPNNKIYVVFKDHNRLNCAVANLAWSYFKTYMIGLTNKYATVIAEHEPNIISKLGIKRYRQLCCRCNCGNLFYVDAADFKRGDTVSCGCHRVKMMLTKGGLSKHPLYHILRGMYKRCYKQGSAGYSRYGGRGITICAKWAFTIKGIANFITWAEANGYKKGLTIDRIDNDGNYEPSNCRWATRKVQARNTSRNRMLTLNGKTKCVAEWAEELEVSYDTVYQIIKSNGANPQQ